MLNHGPSWLSHENTMIFKNSTPSVNPFFKSQSIALSWPLLRTKVLKRPYLDIIIFLNFFSKFNPLKCQCHPACRIGDVRITILFRFCDLRLVKSYWTYYCEIVTRCLRVILSVMCRRQYTLGYHAVMWHYWYLFQKKSLHVLYFNWMESHEIAKMILVYQRQSYCFDFSCHSIENEGSDDVPPPLVLTTTVKFKIKDPRM